MKRILGIAVLVWFTVVAADTRHDTVVSAAGGPTYHSPSHISLAADGATAYVVDTTAQAVIVLDVAARRVVARIPVGAQPVTAVPSADGRKLFVACRFADGVDIVDLEAGRVSRTIATDSEPYGLCASADGRSLYVTHSVAGTVSCFSTDTWAESWHADVGDDPRPVVEIDGGRRLVVGNGLSRSVSILDATRGELVESREMGRASLVRDLATSADGRWAFASHVVSHDEQMTLQMERGWIHSNGITVLDLERRGHYVTLLLDRILRGAANPWGLALSRDGGLLYVTLAGVHEVAIVDLEKALQLVAETGTEEVERLAQDVEVVSRREIARRVPCGGNGPRAVAVSPATGEVLVANYFSGDVAILDGVTGALLAVVPLGPRAEPTLERRGEELFNDARLCFQRWYSCASCHQEDATVDGLNWDLANDGLGNPKSAKSMHDICDTPPGMWSSVRADMDAAVAAGQRFLGHIPDPENHRALMAYIGAARRAPNPYRRRVDEERFQSGKRVYYRAGCAACHPPPLYTDLRQYEVVEPAPTDLRRQFDTPSLRECYRTAPFMHDGRAMTLRTVFNEHNPDDLHGKTSDLTDAELNDLLAFLRCL